MFYDTRFSHVSRSQFLKAHPRPPWVKTRGGFHRWENREISLSEIKVLRHTTRGNQLGRDTTRERKKWKKRRKGRNRRMWNRKSRDERRNEHRSQPPFAFIRLRDHSALYILFCRLPFVYFFSSSRMSIFLVSFSSLFYFPVFGTALHRAVYSCRLRFIIPQLFRIHATSL